MPVASEVGNLHFKFGQARPSVSGVIRYVRDGRTNERTKPTLNAPFHTVGGIIKFIQRDLQNVQGREQMAKHEV